MGTRVIEARAVLGVFGGIFTARVAALTVFLGPLPMNAGTERLVVDCDGATLFTRRTDGRCFFPGAVLGALESRTTDIR